MITTITLNVAVDKAYTVERMEKGTVMRVKTCSNTAGGKGLNVAKVVKLCGEEVTAAGFVGGHAGEYVVDMLNAQGVPNRFIHTKGETRSCINVLAADGSSTEFLEPGEPVEPEDVDRFLAEYHRLVRESSVLTISGSMQKGIPENMYQRLISQAKEAGKAVILDTSGTLLENGIKALPTMIKPNDEEIEMLLGTPAKDREQLILGARRLHELGIPMVVVSLGGDGALLVTREGVFHGCPPKIQTVNTVGCGDSMTAAFAVGLKRGYETPKMLRYAVAVSAANALTMQTGSFRKEDMERILPQVTVKKLA
ncbi:MAG TPA: 1-phosphofructokinase [Candidatus Limivivens intestinipullorum]|uniref:Tagatose-6-phosphate kinase n=1 Tax=Candidatus Limivivens intestinipullorum TaxID=2840858 RepID=A0A9D1JIR6_9FIRM|nr:1-phosphofructokinase [Candidatus Limivivens intestinipullorum]